MRIQIDAKSIACMKLRLGARQYVHGASETPQQRRAWQGMVYRLRLQGRKMQNADFIAGGVALKALIPSEIRAFGDAPVLVLQESVGFDLGTRSDSEILLKRLTVDIRAEVLDIGYSPGL